MQELWIDTIASELGDILLVTDEQFVCAIEFANCADRMQRSLIKRFGAVDLVEQSNPLGVSDRLHAYLARDFTTFENVPVDPGGTPFQRTVWSALRTIPSGTTVTYQALATRIGQPTACRAVGLANSQNPIAIVLPCHRVIGRNGTLTGYAGGLDRKRWLLNHEGALERSPLTTAQQLALF